MEWLNRYMERDSESSSPWLTQWIEKIGQHQLALRIMGYALCALIVLSALWIVYRELKAADALGWRRRARGVEALPAGDASRAGIARDLERCDPVDRPSVVLELIAAAVARSEDKGTDPSATHRELAARLGLVIPQQRGVVDRLAACAERVRYAPSLPAPADIDAVVRNGVAVLQSLVVARRAQS